MANYYSISIESEKMKQQVAADIFNFVADKRRIADFDYHDGELHMEVRGYIDLREILTKHGFDKTDFTQIMDEFTRGYRYIVDENYKNIAKEIEEDVAAGKYTIWAVGEEEEE